MWSYGVVVWEIFTNCENRPSVSIAGLLKIPCTFPWQLTPFIKLCWEDIPSDRPTFSQICEYLGKWPMIDEEASTNEDYLKWDVNAVCKYFSPYVKLEQLESLKKELITGEVLPLMKEKHWKELKINYLNVVVRLTCLLGSGKQ